MLEDTVAVFICVVLIVLLLVANWVILYCFIIQPTETNNQKPCRLIKITKLITFLRNKFQSIESKQKELEERINQLSPCE